VAVSGYIAAREALRRLRLKGAGGLATRAQAADPGAEILKVHLFDQQRAVIDDPSPLKSLCCSRRSGKSVFEATTLAYIAKAYPGSEGAGYGPTLGMAKRNLLAPLRTVARRYNLGGKYDSQDNVWKWPNGSLTYFFGADKWDEIDKARGLALHIAVVDEAQRFKDHLLQELMDEVLTPALEDYEGQLYLAGTPKAVLSGLFYESSTNDTLGWSRHHWTVADNIYFPRYLKMQREDPRYRGMSVREIAQARLQALMESRGWDLSTPKVRREWLGEWARDETSLIYPYDPVKNSASALPEDHEWRFGLGVDVGMNAFVVMAWAATSPNLYFVDAEKTRFTTLTKFADDIRRFKRKYNTQRIEVDCANLGKYLVEEVRRRNPDLVLYEADKTRKLASQEALRTDIMSGFAKVLPQAAVLRDEWTKLQYDEDGTEPSKSDNHCSDGALYIHKWARHFAAKPKAPEDTRTVAQIQEDELRAYAWKKHREQRKVRSLASQMRGIL